MFYFIVKEIHLFKKSENKKFKFGKNYFSDFHLIRHYVDLILNRLKIFVTCCFGISKKLKRRWLEPFLPFRVGVQQTPNITKALH